MQGPLRTCHHADQAFTHANLRSDAVLWIAVAGDGQQFVVPLIRKKDLDGAAKELAAVQKIAADPKLIEAPTSMSLNLADSVLRIASEVMSGELAAAQGDYDKAIAHLDRAVRYEDAMIYTEPDDWHQPVRHNLGAVLLQAGRPVEAESVYWDDLKRHPQNGWALYGLAQALRAQGKNDEAKRIDADFKKAWSDADVQLTASRF